MTYSLGTLIKIDGVTIAAISHSKIAARGGRQASVLVCSKQPILLLIQIGLEVKALDMTGAKVTLAKVLEQYPTALDQFLDIAGENRPRPS